MIIPDPEQGICRECLEEAYLDDGVCDDCRYGEECPTCEGSGYGEGWDDEDGAEECDECGGSGRIP